MWEKLDEVLGAAMLTGIATLALYLNIGPGIAETCVTGIVALLAVKAARLQAE